jgi:hypothetical protein
MELEWYLANWRGLELANSRSPLSGRAWSGLRQERDVLTPTERDWIALAKYTALHCTRRTVDHRTAFQQAYGRDSGNDALMNRMLRNGTLNISQS